MDRFLQPNGPDTPIVKTGVRDNKTSRVKQRSSFFTHFKPEITGFGEKTACTSLICFQFLSGYGKLVNYLYLCDKSNS